MKEPVALTAEQQSEKKKSRNVTGDSGGNPDKDGLPKNKKPYRTKAQKKLARENHRKCEDGAFRSDAPRSHHN